MLNSLKRYSTYFFFSAFSPAGKYVVHDLKRYVLKKEFLQKGLSFTDNERKEALNKAIRWLITAQEANHDGGMGSYHLISKWSSSYPETTGYIIPTLILYGEKYDDPETVNAAIRAADFLLKIQKPSGGWQGGRMNDNRPEIVFNTGQVIRGMLSAYSYTGKKIYLEAAEKAGSWLAAIQHPEGYWQEHALMNQARVYDTFVDAPLLDLSGITGEPDIKKAAIQNLEWVISEKLIENGWFKDCDNTEKRNSRPILHTIAYTLDGLIDSGLYLKKDNYVEAAAKGSKKLREMFLFDGFLPGRFDDQWTGSENMICTGSAQMAIIWLKLYKIYGDEAWFEAAHRMINLLIFIQSRTFSEINDTVGAIPGSFPLWGRYEPFAFPNWATKFFCDALLLEEELGK